MSIYTRRERSTGKILSVGRAEDFGLEALPREGWVVVCEEHATLVTVETRRDALRVTPVDFCEPCNAEE